MNRPFRYYPLPGRTGLAFETTYRAAAGSARLLEKCGFAREEVRRRYVDSRISTEARPQDVPCYAILL